MSQSLKLLLICFLASIVFTAKQNNPPSQDGLIPPRENGNTTNATAEQPVLPGVESNGRAPLPALPVIESNTSISREVGESNATCSREVSQSNTPISREEQGEFGVFPDIQAFIREANGKIGNFSMPIERQQKPSAAGEKGISAEAPLPASTIINVRNPVVSINGQALGTVAPDLIRIGVVVQNQGEKAEDSLRQNDQTVKALIAKIKLFGVTDRSILNLGQRFRVSSKVFFSSSSSSPLVSYSQLEIQVDDIRIAGKIVDLLQSYGHQIKYIDFGYQPETLEFAVNNLIRMALADAEKRAKGALSGTSYQLGKLLNLNVNLNTDFRNYMNEGQYQPGSGSNPATPKIIKAVVSATYEMEPKNGGVPTGQPVQPPLPVIPRPVQPVQPPRPVTPRPVQPVQPARPVQPAQPVTEPIQPVTEPTQPTRPSNPVIEPTESTQTTLPTQPTEPTQPVTEPTQPTQPETQPTKPETEPTQPKTVQPGTDSASVQPMISQNVTISKNVTSANATEAMTILTGRIPRKRT